MMWERCIQTNPQRRPTYWCAKRKVVIWWCSRWCIALAMSRSGLSGPGHSQTGAIRSPALFPAPKHRLCRVRMARWRWTGKYWWRQWPEVQTNPRWTLYSWTAWSSWWFRPQAKCVVTELSWRRIPGAYWVHCRPSVCMQARLVQSEPALDSSQGADRPCTSWATYRGSTHQGCT